MIEPLRKYETQDMPVKLIKRVEVEDFPANEKDIPFYSYSEEHQRAFDMSYGTEEAKAAPVEVKPLKYRSFQLAYMKGDGTIVTQNYKFAVVPEVWEELSYMTDLIDSQENLLKAVSASESRWWKDCIDAQKERNEVHKQLSLYEKASLWDRIKYVFTGEIKNG